jgi:hypothetical protein
MMVGKRLDTPSTPKLYHLGALKNERLERAHRTQKDMNTQNGGGAGSKGEDKMDLSRQFLMQFIRMRVS